MTFYYSNALTQMTGLEREIAMLRLVMYTVEPEILYIIMIVQEGAINGAVCQQSLLKLYGFCPSKLTYTNITILKGQS